ncbi:Tubulin polyglutamylase TTLL4 [Habropoda laboriosa]|uniref:Tubulin polyglutamylase TTLL4 n=1 Tax=Habropoda laboriosa TaxID=597456 RepID=A0A0L7QRB4_9HYME|nr:PREDICTED: tubulin polyglutamylase TTLL4-like [Habropoda laboriosa]KOC61041.1 Tubulin polyglutamylase TTLL4 [Habropoda laboriosa]
MANRQPRPKRRNDPAKSVIQSYRDSCTSTRYGKLSTNYRYDDDEMYTYIEITERLIITGHAADRCTIHDPVGSGDKNLTLPMRRSLFAHVPPFIIFRDNGTFELPTEITKHLLWWQAKTSTPRIVTSMVRKSGFRTTSRSTANWCGTWCSFSAYTKLRRTRNFSKVNHFPSSVELGDKISLWRNFRRMRRKFGRKHFDFMPLTFILPEDRCSLKRFMQRNGGFWIVKPPNSCAGSGIKIVSHFYEIPLLRSLVVQRYISWPKLINGIKFDIRLYVLLTSIDPLRIYVYNEGLVRLATIRYVNHVSTLSDRFMHLTNTSVNKVSPNFQPNDDPNKCKGNIWSLNCLWKYLAVEDVDTLEIWTKIKEIAVKTVISAEPFLLKAWKKTSMSTYNFHQLFGFDVLLDRHYRPWLLEVNHFPSMMPDTPLCRLVKRQLAKDYLNLVGFHVPDLLSGKELKILRLIYKENAVCYNRHLYTSVLTWEDSKKQRDLLKRSNRKHYLKSILKNLTPDDVRVLIRHEDEITRTGRFEKIFPTCNTYKYFDLFEEVRYYNLLLDAWENEHGYNRSRGIERLRKLCRKKYHLS